MSHDREPEGDGGVSDQERQASQRLVRATVRMWETELSLFPDEHEAACAEYEAAAQAYRTVVEEHRRRGKGA